MNGSHEAIDRKIPWQKIKEDIGKTSKLAEGKAHVHHVVAYCNIGVVVTDIKIDCAAQGPSTIKPTKLEAFKDGYMSNVRG
jgi:hypothetical protein